MVNPDCIIIGSETGTRDGEVQKLIDFYHPMMKNDTMVNVGTWDEAEAIKIFYNTFISAKVGLVNMVQDVAEKNGNINVDIVTDALKNATHRITGPKYMTAGMGDGGSCHPRDNIALRWLSNELDLGYDMFHAIMHSRDMQAKNMANKLAQLSVNYKMQVVIHGRAYKPGVEYTIGSYSELVGFYLKKNEIAVSYVDPLTGDNRHPTVPSIFLMAHDPMTTYAGTGLEETSEYKFYCEIPGGSVILDPWRRIKKLDNVIVFHYGNRKYIG
jgi:UDPglucose 6-dehydrogenase